LKKHALNPAGKQPRRTTGTGLWGWGGRKKTNRFEKTKKKVNNSFPVSRRANRPSQQGRHTRRTKRQLKAQENELGKGTANCKG